MSITNSVVLENISSNDLSHGEVICLGLEMEIEEDTSK